MNELTHKILEDKAVEFLRKKGCWLAQQEVEKIIKISPFRKARVIMDVVGAKKALLKTQWYIIEAKLTYDDFNDKHRLAHYKKYPISAKKYFISPYKVILEKHLRQKGLSNWGLIWVYRNGKIEVVRLPK